MLPYSKCNELNSFIESKKLNVGHKKCCVIQVGKKTGSCLTLKVNDKIMHREESTNYLDNIFHSSGKAKYNFLERTSKAHSILPEILAIIAQNFWQILLQRC